MELKMETRKELINRFSKSYQKAVKSQKGRILDTFVAASGYTRHYASYLLRYNNKTIKRIINGRLIIYKVNVHKRKKRQGKRIYDDEVYKTLKKLWYTSYCLCGKLFKAGIPDYLISLKKDNDFIISDEVRSKLLKISSPTID
ncbi:transposase, partial [bacterium]|nr:transposase [bacterium]